MAQPFLPVKLFALQMAGAVAPSTRMPSFAAQSRMALPSHGPGLSRALHLAKTAKTVENGVRDTFQGARGSVSASGPIVHCAVSQDQKT